MTQLIGQPAIRREDPPLITGRGRFTDDVALPGMLHAFVVRSPVAHARITAVDMSAAREAPGVAAVFTAADLEGVGPLPGAEGLPPDSRNTVFPVLATEKVLWAGQPVALVVAETPAQAADAAELADVSYDELPAVTDPLAATAPDAPVLHAPGDKSGNVAFVRQLRSGDPDGAFAAAAHIIRQRMVSQRIAPVALEPRGVVAWTGDDGRLEVRLPTQRPHGARNSLAKILDLPADRVHVDAGDVGGGFGAKGPLYPDQVAVIAAARVLGRPVKWIETRSESFLATTHGRDQVADLEMAVDADGRVTAIRGTVHASFGAYFTSSAPGSLLGRLGPMLPQGYSISSIDVSLVGVFANTTPIGPYRGAGRPEAAYFTERLMDLAAAEIGLDPAELRRRNFVRKEDFPYRSCTGLSYESGDYHACLGLLLEKIGYAELRAEQARSRDAGRLLGIGFGCFVEPGGITPRVPGPDGTIGDQATVTVSPSGKVTVAVGTSAHGQGHETAFAQLAASLLGVPDADVTVVFGDSDTAPFGYGTFGSRSAVAGGTAIYHACQAVLAAAKRVDAPMPLTEAAARLGGLTATAASGAPPETYASGAYACVAEVDPATGRVTVRRLVAVDDCGVVINPLLVEGQVHGGIAQGLGQALTEQVSYDSSGQPMSASLMDYAVPFAASLPPLECHSVSTPAPTNPLGVKGMGESGTLGATPAVVNAVLDALRTRGVRHLDMPLTSEKIWTALQSAR
jgi:carbon-monoxide dehydrogenase large subunit